MLALGILLSPVRCLTPPCQFHRRKGLTMITLSVANKIIEAAIKKANEIKQPMCIAVVDEGGNMVQHVRMDGGCLGSVDISLHKAFTSRAFNCSTKNWATTHSRGSSSMDLCF